MTTFALKNIKIAEFASEETWCFEATLYVDGKKIGRVSNDGHGGPNYYDFEKDEFERVAALVTGDIQTSFNSTVRNDIEIVIGDLINRHMLIKEAKRWQKQVAKDKGVSPSSVRVFVIRGDKEDQFSAVWNDKWTDEMVINKVAGGERIDNAKVEIVQL